MSQQLKIERKGGLAGFGAPGSSIRSRGALDLATLSPADRDAIQSLFKSTPAKKPAQPDAFQYHLTIDDKTVVVPEDDVPDAVRDAVEDEIE